MQQKLLSNDSLKLYKDELKIQFACFERQQTFLRLKQLNNGVFRIETVSITEKNPEEQARETANFIKNTLTEKSPPILPLEIVCCAISVDELINEKKLINYYPWDWDEDLDLPIELKDKLKKGIAVTYPRFTLKLIPKVIKVNKLRRRS